MNSKIKEKNVQNLIIDLRFNSGGHSGMGDYLLNYLTSESYRMFSKMKIKLSEELLFPIVQRFLFIPGRAFTISDIIGLAAKGIKGINGLAFFSR